MTLGLISIESPPMFDEGTEEIQAPVGASVTLEWSYTGHPVPSIEWEHNERIVVPSERVQMDNRRKGLTKLCISGVMRSDEGIYTCCILNSLGSDIQRCSLVVIGKFWYT